MLVYFSLACDSVLSSVTSLMSSFTWWHRFARRGPAHCEGRGARTLSRVGRGCRALRAPTTHTRERQHSAFGARRRGHFITPKRVCLGYGYLTLYII